MVSNINAILANHIVVLTENYKKHVKDHLWFKKLIHKYKVIPNGVNTQKFSAKKAYFEKDNITVFMASRMNKLRDHETLIQAIKSIREKGVNIQLRIAGDGETLMPLKEKYNHLQYISFLGNIKESKIIKELHHADIYVHATFAETFSTAILQAMSCGLPVIASNIEGTKHMISYKHTGLLYENKNIKDLEQQIEMLIKDKQLAKLLGNNARIDVEQKYTMNNIAIQYSKLF
jgi:glycosyltransferase involved in cell wall biosynthesis